MSQIDDKQIAMDCENCGKTIPYRDDRDWCLMCLIAQEGESHD